MQTENSPFQDLKKSASKTEQKANEPFLPPIFKGGKIADLMATHFEPLQQMFSGLLHEEELSILFADTNLGKSILAVQIAEEISKPNSSTLLRHITNRPLEPIDSEVLYFDFEMNQRQFKHRYTNQSTLISYSFSENIERFSLDWSEAKQEEPIKELMQGLESMIASKKPKLIIIDNLTYLQADGGITSKEAGQIMKGLKKLKESASNGLSILVIAHTPKMYDNSKPITLNSLAGSKNFSNFADSIFCIGQSYEEETTNRAYIKQLKTRAEQHRYGQENVIVVDRCQKNDGLLSFDFVRFDSEIHHLFKMTKEVQKANRDTQIIDMLNTHTVQQVADHFGLSKGQVSKINKNKKQVDSNNSKGSDKLFPKETKGNKKETRETRQKRAK